MPPDRLTILFSGMLAGDPHQGGATWAVLQYILGLRQLGHHVYMIEPVRPDVPSAAVDYFHAVTAEFGLIGSAALQMTGTHETVGLPYADLVRIARRADMLLNVSGMLSDPELAGPPAVRVYLDLDPAFVQFWHTQGIDLHFAGHTHFVTVGLAIGTPDCAVPTCGEKWITTLQPVALDHWPMGDAIADDALTTIGNFRGYGSVEHDGVFYGQKAHSLRTFIELPTRTRERFRLALAIHSGETKDLAALASNKWEIIDPAKVAGTPADYRRFIQGSKAEFGLAKSGYVASRCGWFSDRSACYLAAGRPVIAQDTGFGRFLPTGEGLFAFTTADDVLAAIDELNRDYAYQRRAARAIAEEYFDSGKVLGRLLRQIGVGP